jgi:acetylornithine deacetylase/succinyl-diaminopimelate desuccinylase-like protein
MARFPRASGQPTGLRYRAGMTRLDPATIRPHVERVWRDDILPALVRYVAIPNKSPLFDPDWERAGHMDRAVDLIASWCEARDVPDLAVEVVRLPGRTPLLVMEVPGDVDDTVLLYGHLDKQPEMSGWDEGLGPWKPVVKGDRLYGRGGADDGYAAFASLTALEALARARARHARCILLIEACEESGSPDLPAYVAHLADRIGEPSLVICLDSGCGNYDQLWGTTSLRGMVTGELQVEVLREGVHSGDAGGIVPSSFRVLRQLLSRLEDEATGALRPGFLAAEVPADRRAQAAIAARVLGDAVHARFPFVPGTGPLGDDGVDRVLRRTWGAALEVTGMDGIPSVADGGNVLRPDTRAKLSLRLPPVVDGEEATARVKSLLEADPPDGARVRFEPEPAATGWNAPPSDPWLEEAANDASQAYFGQQAVFMGEGGTIPFMAMLGERFPHAQFLITGVLGPGANAHGPNEFLHLPTGTRLTSCVAEVLAAHAARPRA